MGAADASGRKTGEVYAGAVANLANGVEHTALLHARARERESRVGTQQIMDSSGAVSSALLLVRLCPNRAKVKLGACHSFDDKHHAGASGTAYLIALVRMIDANRCAEQFAATFERITPSAVGEEAEVADANQAFWQRVNQKAAQELIG